ncbi:nucleotidyltransferase domain-containing protein [Niveibacterium sp. SC-1]|uniref:nucleotidyltransferase domain-containing protein n=1 Tax=Niveibacterium sp. SC-1 TaxID=3135646 RepID=UPI00311FA113
MTLAPSLPDLPTHVRPHHRATIARVIERHATQPGVLALILAGSVIRGEGAENSDIDFMLVVDLATQAERAARNALCIYDPEAATYEGGYADGKVVDVAFLEEVAGRGNEVIRAAFEGAVVAHCVDARIPPLLARIPVYQDAGHEERLASFRAQLQVSQWYVGEAEKRTDRYLLMKSAADLAFWSARLILAHNRMLYPFHKWLFRRLAAAPEQPAGLQAAIDCLLAEPARRHGDALAELVLQWRDWPDGGEAWPQRFLRDTEWAWRRGAAPVADW